MPFLLQTHHGSLRDPLPANPNHNLMEKEETKNDYIVQEMDNELVNQHEDTYEQYVFVQSRTMSKIYGGKSDSAACAARMDGLVKVSVRGICGKSVYRRVRAKSAKGLYGNSIQIAERTRNLLGVKPTDIVKVSKPNRIAFLWHHPEPSARIAFRSSVAMFCISCLLAIISIILSV